MVEVDPVTGRFSLPVEHAASLTRAAAADNMAVFAQYVAVMGAVEDGIVECFRHGGGVPYERFHRFHEVMAEDSGQSVLSSLESHILPLVHVNVPIRSRSTSLRRSTPCMIKRSHSMS